MRGRKIKNPVNRRDRQPTGHMPHYSLKAASDAQLGDIYIFLQSRPQAAPSKSIPFLNQQGAQFNPVSHLQPLS